MKFNRFFSNRGLGLITDTFILGLGNATQKIILLLLMPIYTSILTTSEYGTIDVIITFVELLVPIFTLNIESAVFRFVIDDDCDREYLLNYSLNIIWKASIIVGFIIGILNLMSIDVYLFYIFMMFLTYSIRNVFANYVRGIGRIRLFAVGGILSTISLALSNILILTVIGAGIKGYFIAIILSNIVNIIILLIFEREISINFKKSVSLKNIFSKSIYDKKNQEYLNYSTPLIPNTLSWWINSASGRYILLFFWGPAITGLYSAAIKIPSIINLFSTVFQQAWQYYAAKENSNENRIEFYRKVYLYFGISIIFICSVVIQLSKIISTIILRSDFFVAWNYVPFLVLSSAIATISVFFGGLYTAEKRSKDLMISTIIGSVTNIIILILLTQALQIKAIIIASIVSNLIIFIMRIHTCSKQLEIRFRQKNIIISFLLLFVQSILISINTVLGFWIALSILIVIIIINTVQIAINQY